MEPSKDVRTELIAVAPHGPAQPSQPPETSPITLRKLRGGFLVGLGYLLSPLCWWNDLIFNLPVAWGVGYLLGLISPHYFLGGAIVGYWLSNLVGILLMQFGAVDVLQKPTDDRNLTKELLMGVATSTAYTLFVLVLCHFKVIDLTAVLPDAQSLSVAHTLGASGMTSAMLLVALSFVVGAIVGLTGIGGASLITPMLIFGFQVPVAVAVSSDVVAATLMKVVGGWKHWQQQTLDLQVVKWLALGSVPGALSGVALLHALRGVKQLNLDALLLHLVGFAILFVTLMALVQLLLLTFAPDLQLPELPKLDLDTGLGRSLAVAIGLVLGCVVGLTSVSSGSMFALVMIAFFKLDTRKLVGTDLAQAAILLLFTSLGHLTLGTVDWSLVIPIWIGSVPGVLLGAKLCQIVPQKLLRFVVYALLVMVSWKLANQA